MKLFINVSLVERMLGRKVAWEKTGWTTEERAGMSTTTFHMLEHHRHMVHSIAAQGPPRPEPGRQPKRPPKEPPLITSNGGSGSPSSPPFAIPT